MTFSKLQELIDSLESISEAERVQIQKELGRQTFKYRRLEMDRTIAINILEATINDLEKSQLITKEANRQLSEQQVVIEHNAYLLEENLRKLELSYKELEQFSYIASHDLKSPLRTIASFAQLLKKRYYDQLDQEANEYIDFIVSGIFQMDRVLQTLLNYSKVADPSEDFVYTDLNEVLEIVKRSLQKEIQDSSACITYEQLPIVYGNKTAFIQLFQNLTSNAIKFKSELPPAIHISCSLNAEEWVFRFEDNGVGIEAGFEEKVFFPFQRLHQDTTSGMGIGLAICKKVVKMHNGDIHVEPGQNGGTAFVFTLPAQDVKEGVVVSE